MLIWNLVSFEAPGPSDAMATSAYSALIFDICQFGRYFIQPPKVPQTAMVVGVSSFLFCSAKPAFWINEMGQDGLVLLTWLPDKFRVSWHFGSFNIDFQDGSHGGYIWFTIRMILAILICTSPQYFRWGFESIGLSIKEKKIEIDLQDGGRGGHLGLPIVLTLAIFDLQVISILSIKFRVHLPFGLSRKSKKNIFSTWRLGDRLGFPIGTI